MAKPNLTRYAVLGLLDLEPRTGYDIKRFVETAMGHFWSESHRWIYTTLEQLEADGLATARPDDRGRRQRVRYRITTRGRRALRDWLAEPAPPESVRDEFLLRIMLGRTTTPKTLAEHVRRHREQMTARQQEIGDLAGRLEDLGLDGATRRYLGVTIELRRRLIAAHLKWCEDALREIRSAPSRGRKAARQGTGRKKRQSTRRRAAST